MTFRIAACISRHLGSKNGLRWGAAAGLASLGYAGGVHFAVHRDTLCEPVPQNSQKGGGTADLLRLSYTSTMCGTSVKASDVIDEIVHEAVKRNSQLGISGHLCYDAGSQKVWQVLEGNVDAVDTVWTGILRDSRHVIDDDTVEVELVETRKYPTGWGLRYRRFERVDGEAREENPHLSKCALMQLAYKSFIADPDSGGREVMHTILPQAMMKNAKAGITGWLLYNDRSAAIYQVLEGPPEAVEGLWQRISRDPRHTVCQTSIVRKEVAAREFPNWSMGADEVAQWAWAAQGY